MTNNEKKLRPTQLAYLALVTKRPEEVLARIIRQLPTDERIELKRAIRECMRSEEHVSLREMYEAYADARRD